MKRTEKIVITGASGFLGRNLLLRLKGESGCETAALSSCAEELRKKFSALNIRFFPREELLGTGAGDLLKDAVVIHCAFPRNQIGSEMADGLHYTESVFRAARDHGAGAVINISSQSVYSQKRTEEADEESPLSLESPYAVGKYASELLLDSFFKGSGVHFTSLRMASLIGPGFDQRIVNRFVKTMLEGKAVTVVREEKRFGFLDVEDAVSAVLSLVQCDSASWRPVYTVGNGKAYTVLEIYENTVSILGRYGVEILPPVFTEGTEVSTTQVSYGRLNRDTGFEPAFSLSESIEKIVKDCLDPDRR